MEIKTSELTGKAGKEKIAEFIAKKQLFIILEIGKGDNFRHYPELIAQTGRFIKDETFNYIFTLEAPVRIEIQGSVIFFNNIFLVDATLGIVHESFTDIKKEINLIEGVDEEGANDNLNSTDND